MEYPIKYPEYKATQIAQYIFFEYDYDSKDVPGKEYIETLNRASPFSDKLKERAITLGYSGDPADVETLRDFLFQLIQSEQGIIDDKNARGWRTNLKNWLVPRKGSSAPVMPGRREFVYQLCFALRMNALEAGEFFIKGYLERPYNFKDLKETVYFYCLNNGLHYVDAVALFQIAKDIPFEENADSETDTVTIGRVVCEFRDKNEFLDYIRQNRWSFETKSVSAKNKITELIKQCCVYATKEFNMFRFADKLDAEAERDKRVEQDDGKKKGVSFEIKPLKAVEINNAEALLKVIYGYHYRATENDVPAYVKTVNQDSNFPQLIRKNMVANAQQLAALQDGTAPDSITRSALVLFKFYHFFADAKDKGRVNTVDLFDEFIDEMDTMLFECGYGQFYWQNPYDWMIGYCAKAPDPIEELRNLISEFFSDDDTAYIQANNEN